MSLFENLYEKINNLYIQKLENIGVMNNEI